MARSPSIPRVLNVLIVLGILANVALIVFVIMTIRTLKNDRIPPANLGEQGARCGGPNRYPCKPGFVCSEPPESWTEREGTCVPDQRPAFEAGQFGDACDEGRGCAPGFLCERSSGTDTGTCQPAAAGASNPNP